MATTKKTAAPTKKKVPAVKKKPAAHSPFSRMKEKFGEKEALVDRLLSVISLGEEERDAVKTRLLAVSNKKLMRLFDVASEVKSKYGTPEKLAEAVAQAAGKSKDAAFVARLTKLAQRTPARVLDLLKSHSG